MIVGRCGALGSAKTRITSVLRCLCQCFGPAPFAFELLPIMVQVWLGYMHRPLGHTVITPVRPTIYTSNRSWLIWGLCSSPQKLAQSPLHWHLEGFWGNAAKLG